MTEAVALNTAPLLPAGTWTRAGTVSWALLDESATVSPPVGAGADNVSAQAVCPPPVSVCGLHEIELCACAARRVTDCVLPPVMEIDADVSAATADAVIVNVALVIPDPIVTVVGIVRLPEDEISETEVLAGAGFVTITVQMPVPGVWMAVGVQLRLASVVPPA